LTHQTGFGRIAAAGGLPAGNELKVVALRAAMFATGVTLAAFLGIFSPAAGMIVLVLVSSLALVNVNLRIAVLLVAALLPFDFHRLVGGFWVYIDLAVLPLAVMFRHNRPPRRSFVLFPFVAWVMLADFWRAAEPHVFFSTFIRWLEVGILCCAVAAAAAWVAKEVFLVLGCTLIPLSLYAVYQVFIGDFGDLYRILIPRFEGEVAWLPGRASSLFFGANTFGGFSALLLVVLLTLAMGKVNTKICVFLSGFAVLGLLCSGSRGGAMGAVAGLLIVLAHKRKLRWTFGFAAVFLAVLWITSNFVELPVERMLQSDDFTVETRLLAFYAGAQAFLAHPIIGIGSTNFVNALYEYTNWPIGDIRSPHNTYLHLLAENGVVGAALFFMPIFYCLRHAWKQREEPVMLACFAAICCACVHGLVDFLWMAPQYSLTMAIILGVTLRLPIKSELSRATQPTTLPAGL
jgi:O-antigen ligase